MRFLPRTDSMRRNLFIFFMLMPSILMVLVFIYYPVIRGIPVAFQYYNLVNLAKTRWVGWANFRKLFSTATFLRSLPNTVRWVFISLFFQFTVGFTLALFLKRKFRLRGFYQGTIFFPWAISGFLIGILWRWLYNGSYGVINDILIALGFVSKAQPIGFLSDAGIAMWSCIVANVWYGIAFFAIMIQAALQGIPEDLYEAAEVDGANKLHQFFSITLPFLKDVLILTTLLRIIWIFNFADLIYAMTRGGPGGATEIMTSYLLNLVMFGTDYGLAAALGIVLMLVMICAASLILLLTRFSKDGVE